MRFILLVFCVFFAARAPIKLVTTHSTHSATAFMPCVNPLQKGFTIRRLSRTIEEGIQDNPVHTQARTLTTYLREVDVAELTISLIIQCWRIDGANVEISCTDSSVDWRSHIHSLFHVPPPESCARLHTFPPSSMLNDKSLHPGLSTKPFSPANCRRTFVLAG